MSPQSLQEFGACRQARELFAWGVADRKGLRREPLGFNLVSEPAGSTDSISVNSPEGHGRLSRAEPVRFLASARGWARGTRGRDVRLMPWVGRPLAPQQTALAEEISGMVSALMELLRDQSSPNSPATLPEEETRHGC